MMLIRSNIQASKQGTRTQNLKETIRDATFVTRALGLDCLWVDTLCVLQGGTEDWLAQSSRRRKYTNNQLLHSSLSILRPSARGS